MAELLASLLGPLLAWFAEAWWRPALGALVGAGAVLALGFFVARLVAKAARAALGTAWMLGAIVLASLFIGGWLLDAGLAAHPDVPAGASVLEFKLLGWFPGATAVLPLAERPLLGLVIYQGLLTPLYGFIVWLIWWSLHSGAHVGAGDRAQAAGWVHQLTGRDPAGRLEPGFVRWARPLLRALGLLVAIAAVQLVLQAYEPHPAAWVTAQLFLTGCLVNLRAGDPQPEEPEPEAKPEPAEEEAAALPPPPPSMQDVLDRLNGQDVAARQATGGALASRAARHDPAALADAHPALAAFCRGLADGAGPRQFQATAMRRARDGASTLLVGPAGSGRTAALQLVALDAALSRWEHVCVLTPTPEDAVRFAGRLRGALSEGETPDLVRVAAGLAELASERQAGHDPVVFVTTARELLGELTGAGSIRPGFYRGLRTVLVDDLGRFDPADTTALRLALAELRLAVTEALGQPAEAQRAPLALVASSLAWGEDMSSWAAGLLGVGLESLDADGAPRPRTDVLVVRPEGAAGLKQGPQRVLDAIRGAGFRVQVVDELHPGHRGRASFAPFPAWELGTAVEAEAEPAGVETLGRATLVLARRADLQLAMRRHRPLGPVGAAPHLLVLYAADAAIVPASVVASSLAAAQGKLGSDGQGAGSAARSLRLMPPGQRVAAVERAQLLATLTADTHDEAWLRRVFQPAEVDALAGFAGAQGVLERRERTALDGEPATALLQVPTLSLSDAPSLTRQPGWQPPAQTVVAAHPGGEALISLDARIADGLVHPQAKLVVDGAGWRLSGDAPAPGATRRALRQRGATEIIRRLAELRLSPVAACRPPRQLSFQPGARPLVVDAQRVVVREAVRGFEELSADGAFSAAVRFESEYVSEYPATALRLRLPGAGSAEGGAEVGAGASLALALAVRIALVALVALSEEDLEVLAEAAPAEGEQAAGTAVWVVERAPVGGELVPWLADHVVMGRWFWQVVQEVLGRGAKPAWRTLRTDDLAVEPDAAAAHRLVAQITGFTGVGEHEPGLMAMPEADPSGATGAGARCASCGREVGEASSGGRAFTFSREEDGLPQPICLRCHDDAERCDACGIPTEAGLVRFSDGRTSCPACAASSPGGDEALQAVIDEGQRAVARLLPAPAVAGLGIEGLKAQLEPGLPRVLALETWLRAQGHAWQAAAGGAGEDEELSEGFAMWLAYRGLEALGQRRDAERLLSRGDIYGAGLRRMLALESEGGTAAVLAAARGESS